MTRRPRPLTPREFLRRRGTDATTVIACVGDSITRGVMSADWVRLLSDDLGDAAQVINAGVGGDLAENVLRRLDDVIACNPDVVTVLVGTNDVAALISNEWMRGYERAQKPSERPSIEVYRRMLERIVARLRYETEAQIALLEIPILGEDLGSAENERVRAYNAVVHAVADTAGVSVLPLFQPMADVLPKGHRAPHFGGSKRLMGRAMIRHLLLRQSWESIARRYGFALLVDHVHLADAAAQLIEGQVARFVCTALSLPDRTAVER
ncbi:SGNH/GDSL hydrolase family protein [Agromyces albus]|uniref:SGNH hydrolase-type esterase domain-containing protein n=1 Tax=Agromyces albus TaxID=205332 RepID=A0A4Q2L325_9MICO|nr:GDSL-type esterase/lipase family protein [Agromyces albus]RXZ72528.1 hypothetical protein ESP51_03430 [Agromyces albus]